LARISASPKPSFTADYELVGVVEEVGPDCKLLRAGDRIDSLTVWGADAERVCVPEVMRSRCRRTSTRRDPGPRIHIYDRPVPDERSRKI
jgi:NADPH:quinone reductase-like Zn-dependent oxidoreductase